MSTAGADRRIVKDPPVAVALYGLTAILPFTTMLSSTISGEPFWPGVSEPSSNTSAMLEIVALGATGGNA